MSQSKKKINKKYELVLTDTKEVDNVTLYRIKLLRSITPSSGYTRYSGRLGGYIQSEKNLSHQGNCWVDNEACVYGNAKVSGDATVRNKSRIYEYAQISDKATVSDNAAVYGSAKVFGRAQITGNPNIFGKAHVSGSAKIEDNAQIFGTSKVLAHSRVGGTATVDDGVVRGEAKVQGNARILKKGLVAENQTVSFSTLKTNICHKTNLKDSIRVQCGLFTAKDELGEFVIAFKHVLKTGKPGVFSSKHDPSFKYEVGKTAICKYPTLSKASCAAGLHVSNGCYWENRNCSAVLMVRVYLKDIITVQDGKIRCKELDVLAEVTNGLTENSY